MMLSRWNKLGDWKWVIILSPFLVFSIWFNVQYRKPGYKIQQEMDECAQKADSLEIKVLQLEMLMGMETTTDPETEVKVLREKWETYSDQ